jgi:hypothetical protein
MDCIRTHIKDPEAHERTVLRASSFNPELTLISLVGKTWYFQTSAAVNANFSYPSLFL